jgi:hypothetical protein
MAAMLLVRFINNPTTLKLEGFRSLKSITLGPNWIPAPPHNTFGLLQQTFGYRRGAPSIIFVSHTQPLPPEHGEALRDTLISGTHEISETEWKQLSPIFGEQANHDEFKLKVSEVLDWNGKLCILNEGTFPDFGLRTYSLFVDANNDGQYLEEIIYQAPVSQFETHLTEALISLQSIDWTSHNRF